jgi:hypothetical protein
MDQPRNDSAGPALRGYRLQMLYTLARLTEPRSAVQATLWPEGVEDLAIFDEHGALREAIQIKAHAAPLTLSELVSKRGSGLLQRAIQTAQEHPQCRLRLLSFGPFGEELEAAWSGSEAARNRVARKLEKAGINSSDATLLFERLTLERAEEAGESAKVDRFLAEVPALAGQSEHAAAILCQWLYGAAERRERITQAELMTRLAHVGRYLHARAGYWRDWFSVIEPLDRELEPDSTGERERLREQFQQGIHARYEHILTGCDIPRRRWLDQISAGFQDASVVIIHGASGQGKSALAYRWLEEETPDLWRLEVKLVDTRRDALQIAATLSGHARAVGAPLTIYIDVRPGDIAWTELVQELARLPQIRVLVSIREEDWRRSPLSGAAVAFASIALTLEEAEAQEIYAWLDTQQSAPAFLSFEEAWQRFVGTAGTEGPMLEFVYLLTRTQTLHERLKQQVDDIRRSALDHQGQAAALDVLALVSFASSLGARIDVASLRAHRAGIDLGYIVERLEREYLLRRIEDGVQLEGLHPVRSRLLAEILCDGITFDTAELAERCLDLIAAQDTEVFLLHVATRHTDAMPRIMRHLDAWQPRTWAASGGVLRALLWWGVRQYVNELSDLVAEIMAERGKAWWVLLDLDIADLSPPFGTAIWQDLDFISDEKKARMRTYLDRQPPKARALAAARRWLASLRNEPRPPVTQADWAAIAELSYWAGRWSIAAPAGDWLRTIELDPALDLLPLPDIAHLVRGRWELDAKRMRPWLDAQREDLAARFRAETDAVWMEEQGGTLRAHFLVAWDRIADDDDPDPEVDPERKNWLHAEALRRIDLMRGLFPDQVGYGCQGYGHHVLPTPHDDTTKTSIKAGRLPADWAARVNALATALVELQFRPADWQDYLGEVWSIREQITAVMRDLRRGLTTHLRKKRKDRSLGQRLAVNDWDSLRDRLGRDLALPQQAVDEWGFVSEGRETDPKFSAGTFVPGFALSRYQPFTKARLDFFTQVKHVLVQAEPYLFLSCIDGAASVEMSRMLLEQKLKEHGDNLAQPGLVSHNMAAAVSALPGFQREFRRLFASRFSQDQLAEQDRRETQTLAAVLALLTAYLDQPTAHWSDPERRATAMMWHAVDQIPERLERALESLRCEGIRARRLPKLDAWDQSPALWIALDSDQSLHSFTAHTFAKPLLREALRQAELSEAQKGRLPSRFEHLVLVPLLRGRAPGKRAWLLSTWRLLSTEEQSRFDWLDQFPRPISDDDWTRSGLTCWQSPEIEAANRTLHSIGRFKALVAHLSDVLKLADIEQADGAPLQAYIDRYRDEWSEIIQALIDPVASLARTVVAWDSEQRAARPFLVEAATAAVDHWQELMPPGLENGAVVLSGEDCVNWLAGAHTHGEGLDTVGAGVLLDALDQAANAADAESG